MASGWLALDMEFRPFVMFGVVSIATLVFVIAGEFRWVYNRHWRPSLRNNYYPDITILVLNDVLLQTFTGIMGADLGCVPRQMACRYPYAKDGRPPIDSSFAYPEVWTTLTAIAVATSRLKLSTAVYVLPLRHPIEVAKATANLALLSDNRLVLGVGWMPEEFSAYGVDFRTRGRRRDEMIEVMRKLWQGGYSDYHGEFFDFPPVALNPSPSAPVPICIGGDSEAALRRAASRAQGWIGTGNSVDEALVILSRLRALRQEHHRLLSLWPRARQVTARTVVWAQSRRSLSEIAMGLG